MRLWWMNVVESRCDPIGWHFLRYRVRWNSSNLRIVPGETWQWRPDGLLHCSMVFLPVNLDVPALLFRQVLVSWWFNTGVINWWRNSIPYSSQTLGGEHGNISPNLPLRPHTSTWWASMRLDRSDQLLWTNRCSSQADHPLCSRKNRTDVWPPNQLQIHADDCRSKLLAQDATKEPNKGKAANPKLTYNTQYDGRPLPENQWMMFSFTTRKFWRLGSAHLSALLSLSCAALFPPRAYTTRIELNSRDAIGVERLSLVLATLAWMRPLACR